MTPLSAKTQEQCELPVRMEVNTMQALAILGTLQLALRHPSFSQTPSAKFIKEFAENLQKEITRNAPGLGFLCDAGWHKQFDHKPDPPAENPSKAR